MKSLLAKFRLHETLLLLSIFAVALALFQVACGGSVDTGRKEIDESLARFALRSYGETQNAYSHMYYNDNSYRIPFMESDYPGYYGTWDELKRAKFISEGVTPENMLEDYTLWANVNRYSVYWYQGNPLSHPPSTFTAVAFPKYPTPVGFLSTFSIREDHVIRMYDHHDDSQNAWGEDDDYSTLTWTSVD